MRSFIAIAIALAGCQADKPKAAPLVLREVQPPFGDPSGGKLTQIVGSGFDTHAKVEVRFGSKPARAIVVSSDRIQLDSPAGTDGEEAEVTVRFPDGRAGKVPQRYRWVKQD